MMGSSTESGARHRRQQTDRMHAGFGGVMAQAPPTLLAALAFAAGFRYTVPQVKKPLDSPRKELP